MISMGVIGDVRSWAGRQKTLVSLGLSASFVAAAIFLLASHRQVIPSLAMLPDWSLHAWALLTYPWSSVPLSEPGDILSLAVEIYLLYVLGGALEREMGSPKYASLFVLLVLIASVFTAIGGQIAYVDWAVAGPWLPIAGLVVAWCNRNPNASIRLWMVVPLPARWIGWLVALGVFVSYRKAGIVVESFACVHLLFAWAYASDRLPFKFPGARSASAKPSTQKPTLVGGVAYDEKYYDDVKRREQERLERERLKKLFGEDDK